MLQRKENNFAAKELVGGARWYVFMNYAVHTLMYAYYAITAGQCASDLNSKPRGMRYHPMIAVRERNAFSVSEERFQSHLFFTLLRKLEVTRVYHNWKSTAEIFNRLFGSLTKTPFHVIDRRKKLRSQIFSAGIRLPRLLSIVLTSLQTIQMFIGVAISFIVFYYKLRGRVGVLPYRFFMAFFIKQPCIHRNVLFFR